jgi:hypothetical protein
VPLDTASGEARSRPISSRGREGPPTDFETGLPACAERTRTQKCSAQNIAFEGRSDARGSGRILATETIRVELRRGETQLGPCAKISSVCPRLYVTAHKPTGRSVALRNRRYDLATRACDLPRHAPLVHPADGVFGSDSSRDAALGNLLRDPNWLLGSGFCWSRRWLGFHNRIGNRLRNIYGFRAGLMSTNHTRLP